MLIRLLTLLLAAQACLSAADRARPNILWLYSDDHAYQAIGAYGGRFGDLDLTPNIDRIADEGVRFDRAYVGNSICAPARATLLTGKHSHRNGKFDNYTGFNHDQQQFQKILQKHGYQTAMVGKIHLKGQMQGFDYWEVLPGQGRYWEPIFITEEGKTVYQGEHSTDVITRNAINWLENKRDKDKPFMAMVHYKAPHRSWQPTTRWKERFKAKIFPEPATLFDDYKGRGYAAHHQDMTILHTMEMGRDVKAKQPERAAELALIDKNDPRALTKLKYQWYMRDYLACIAGVDENIGKLLDYLEESGLAENTIVMYSADQGFYLGEHGWFDKRFMYEESYRAPLVAKWPGVTKPGTINEDLVQNIDYAETFLDIAGVEAPDDMQGESIVPLLKGETPGDWRKSLYYHYYEFPAYWHAVRRHEGVSTDRYKLIRFYGNDVPNGEEWEFYDLEADPNELTNVYGQAAYETEVAALKEELLRLREQYQVPDDVGGLPVKPLK
ncbi:sulfatase [Coraliomargarita sinensis]|uniref:Sulfatase n=1 Tax=Coraliomargarita sinensis TaxID=2174842 RepID=A0A317ZGN0_9BACT|nr:sulfatase [Coraliomargarita sinensis]PXA03383.1 sulfatase [Coraliomargarita sinensis]